MFSISIPRIKRYALILGVTGSVSALLLYGPKVAVGFLVGSALALLTIESWVRVANSLNPESAPESAARKPSVGASGLFLALRYLVIGGAMYATIKVLGVSPVALILGLLVSFAAVIIEILQQVSKNE